MSGTSFGLVLEGLVAILLIVTIAYCFIVNKKLTALREDQAKLRDTVQLLDKSTRNAENIMGELRETAALTQEELDERIEYGRSTLKRLTSLLAEADNLVPQRVEPAVSNRQTEPPLEQPAKPPQSKKAAQAATSIRRVPLKTDMRLSNLMRGAQDKVESVQSSSPTQQGAMVSPNRRGVK